MIYFLFFIPPPKKKFDIIWSISPSKHKLQPTVLLTGYYHSIWIILRANCSSNKYFVNDMHFIPLINMKKNMRKKRYCKLLRIPDIRLVYGY